MNSFFSNRWVRLMRLDKPIGILLLLWPTLWALLLASEGIPNLNNVVIFILGTIVMRSAGCVINDYLDRDIDGHVDRTKSRPLPMGEILPSQAILLFAVLIFVAFGLVLLTNWHTVLVSIIALLITATYPLLKRITNLPQLGLGFAWALVVPMAFTAENTPITFEIGYLFLAIIVWALIFDTYYALVDMQDDLKIGVKSTAILFGEQVLTILICFKFLMMILLILVGFSFQLGVSYYTALSLVSVIFVKQGIKARSAKSDEFLAVFKENNYVGMIIFLGILLGF